MTTATETPDNVIDLRDRVGLRKQEIPYLLPISLREIEDFISAKDFPEGFSLRANGYLKYDRAELIAWWEGKKAAFRARRKQA